MTNKLIQKVAREKICSKNSIPCYILYISPSQGDSGILPSAKQNVMIRSLSDFSRHPPRRTDRSQTSGWVEIITTLPKGKAHGITLRHRRC